MNDEVIVVTGAAAGVGRAVVREFAQPGRAIALLARDTEGLHNAHREVEECGAHGLAIAVDLADAQQVEAAAEQIERQLGPIDIWVNDAMTTIFARFVDVTPGEYHRATEVTYLGTVYGTMAALKRMYPRGVSSRWCASLGGFSLFCRVSHDVRCGKAGFSRRQGPGVGGRPGVAQQDGAER